MLHTITRAVVIAAVAISGLLTGGGAVHAAAPARGLSSVAAVTAVAPTSTVASSSSHIKGSGTTRRFVPNSVTGAPATGTCGSGNYSFFIRNSTMATQQVMYLGAPLGRPIKPNLGLYVCADGAGSGMVTLKNDSRAKLTFTIT